MHAEVSGIAWPDTVMKRSQIVHKFALRVANAFFTKNIIPRYQNSQKIYIYLATLYVIFLYE